MSSNSDSCDAVANIDVMTSNMNDTIMADTGTGISEALSSSAENSALETSTAETSTIGKLTAENSTTEISTAGNLTAENSTAEESDDEGSLSETSISDELTLETNKAPPNFKVPPEICNKILELVISEHVPLTDTVEPPPIAQVSSVLRGLALTMYYKDRDFIIQVPHDEDTRDTADLLQYQLMERWTRPDLNNEDRVKEVLQAEAAKVRAKVDECLEDLEAMETVLTHHSQVTSVRVWSGRFRINLTCHNYNYAPRSFIVGFRASAGDRVQRRGRNEWHRINADGTLDWEDFGLVRQAYVRKLRQLDGDFEGLEYSDVLLHPAVQYIVKELCLLGAAGAPAMEWVEVLVSEWYDWATRRELGMPEYEPDEVDMVSPPPADYYSPPPTVNWWEIEEEEPEEESEHEISEYDSEQESEHEIGQDESAAPGTGNESQDQGIGP